MDIEDSKNVTVNVSSSFSGQVLTEEGTPYFGSNADVSWLLPYAEDSTVVANVSAVYGIDLRDVVHAMQTGQKDGPPELMGLLAALEAGAPEPDFPTIGEPVPLNGRDAGELAAGLGWKWFVPKDGWLFQQDDADRFWVGGGASANWDATGNTNWSATSGGANNASVPTTGDTATFDGNGLSNCTVNVDIGAGGALTSVTTAAGYTNTINVTAAQSTVGGWGATSIAGGTWNTGSAIYAVKATTLNITGGTFALSADSAVIAGSGTITVSGGTWTTGEVGAIGTGAADINITVTIRQFAVFPTAAVTKTLIANLTVSVGLIVGGVGAVATLAVAATTVTVTGTGVIYVGNGAQGSSSGVITVTTGTIDSGTGGVDIGQTSGSTGSFGSNSAWTFNMDGASSLNATGTLSAPNASGSWLCGNNFTHNTSGTLTTNSGTCVVDAACTWAGAGTSSTAELVNCTVNSGITLTVSVDLGTSTTTTVAGGTISIASGKGYSVRGASAVLSFSGSPTISGSGTLYIQSNDGTAIAASTTAYTVSNVQINPATDNATNFSLAGNVTFSGATTVAKLSGAHTNGPTVTVGTTTLTISAAVTVGAAATITASTGTMTWSTTSAITGTVSFTGAGTFTETQEMSIAAGGSFTCSGQNVTASIASARTASAFGVDFTGAGTFNGGTGSNTLGSFRVQNNANFTATSGTTTINGRQSGGDTILINLGTGSFTHNSGTITETQTVANSLFEIYSNVSFYNYTKNSANTMTTYTSGTVTWTIANNLTVTSGTVNTKSGAQPDVNLTVTAATSIATGATLTLNASTVSLGSGLTTGAALNVIGTYTGGSGTHTMGGLYVNGATASCTLTSGTTTFDGTAGNGGWTLSKDNTSSTFAHGSGTVAFTYAGTQYVGNTSASTTTITFNNLSYNNSTRTLVFSENPATARTTYAIAGTLTVTAGTVQQAHINNTITTVAVTGASSITGTASGSQNAGTGASITWQFDGAVTINSGGVLGANAAYTLDCNANLTVSSGGTFSESSGTGATACAFSGATITSSGTWTHNDGRITFDRSGTTSLGSNATGFGFVTIASGATLDTTGSNYSLTSQYTCTVTGTETCNGSTIVHGSGYGNNYGLLVNTGGVFTGGSGTHTFGSLGAAGTASVTMTSGTTTVNSESGGDDLAWALASTNTFSNASGQVTFTAAATTRVQTGTKAFYNVTFNNASGTWALVTDAMSVSNTLTVTAGTLNTSASNLGLTVTSTTTITSGTISCNASAVSLGSGLTAAYGLQLNGGTFTGGSGTHTIGSINASATCTLTFSSGATTINSRASETSFLTLATNSSTTVNHSNGSVLFTMAGNQNLSDSNNTARTMFYDLTVNKASGTLGYGTGTSYNLTVANTYTNTAGTHSIVEGSNSRNLTVTSTSSITGTLSPGTASTITCNGALTINSGGILGTNNNYTLDVNAAMTVSGGGTFTTPTSSGAHTVSGNLTGSTTMTWTQGGVTTVLDGTTQTISGFTTDSATTVLGNLNVQSSTALQLTGGTTQRVGSSQSVVLTINTTGRINATTTAATTLQVSTSNTDPLVFSATPTAWEASGGGQYVGLTVSGTASYNVPALTYNSGKELQFTGSSGVTATQTGTITCVGTTSGNESRFTSFGAGFTYAQNSRAISAPSFRVNTSVTHTITTGSVNAGAANGPTGSNLEFSVANSSTFGSNTAYSLTVDGYFSVASSAVFNAPNATGTFVWAPALTTDTTAHFQITATYNADNGLITASGSKASTFDPNGSTFYNLTASGSGTIALSEALTVSNVLTVSSNFTMQNSAFTLTLSGSGTPFVLSGTFTPGTAATVTYTGSSATNLAATTYYNVGCNQSGVTFTHLGNITANNNVNIASGTWSKPDFALTWTGTLTITDTFSDRNTAWSQASASTGGQMSMGGAGTIQLRRAWWITVNPGNSTNPIYVPEDSVILYNCTMTNLIVVKTMRRPLHHNMNKAIGGGAQGL